jgi:Ca2+-binding RTX toxin-like protein
MSAHPLRYTLLMLLFCTTIGTALAASNTVAGGHVGRTTRATSADTLKPPACGPITLTATVVGSGIFTGTAASELILGSANADTINGAGGDDCILGGAGTDTITGGAGNDVCIGGAGIDVFVTCETQIQ